MRRIASYATNEIVPSGAKRQVRNREVVSCTFLSYYGFSTIGRDHLVFASLILPALASQHIVLVKNKYLVSYLVGLAGYLAGLFVSIQFDLPIGATL